MRGRLFGSILFLGAGDRGGGGIQFALGALARRFAFRDGEGLLKEKTTTFRMAMERGFVNRVRKSVVS